MIEKCVYSRAIEIPKIHMEEIPPIISPALRQNVVLNTEKEKQSSFLKTSAIPEGVVIFMLTISLCEYFHYNIPVPGQAIFNP